MQNILKSYRWVIAVVFVAFSIFFAKERFSMGQSLIKDTASFETLGVEEREVVFNALSRLESKKQYQVVLNKLEESLVRDFVPALVTEGAKSSEIEFKEGEGIIFPKGFFTTDPITQDLVLTKFLDQLNSDSQFAQSSLAKIFKVKTHSIGAR